MTSQLTSDAANGTCRLSAKYLRRCRPSYSIIIDLRYQLIIIHGRRIINADGQLSNCLWNLKDIGSSRMLPRSHWKWK